MRYKPSLLACTGIYTLFPWTTAASHGWRAAHPDLALFFFSVDVSRDDWQLLSPEDPLIAGWTGRVTESCCMSLDPSSFSTVEAKTPLLIILLFVLQSESLLSQNDDMLGDKQKQQPFEIWYVAGNMEQISCAFSAPQRSWPNWGRISAAPFLVAPRQIETGQKRKRATHGLKEKRKKKKKLSTSKNGKIGNRIT